MTKKDKILDTALKLFAEYGFHAVSTARIASEAEVSEGLIFKHYKNKSGLLESIYAQVDQRLQEAYTPMMTEQDPEKVVPSFIDVVTNTKPEEYPFWKLIFQLKWNDNFYRPEEMNPIVDKLSWAMEKMGIKYPHEEAELLAHSMENIAISILRDGLEKNKNILNHLKEKYQQN